MVTGEEIFFEWLGTELPKCAWDQIPLSPETVKFHAEIDEGGLDEFAQAWLKRFTLYHNAHLLQTQVRLSPGWYFCYFSVAQEMVRQMEMARNESHILQAVTAEIVQRVGHIGRLANPTTRVLVQARAGTASKISITNLTFASPNGALALVPFGRKQQFCLVDRDSGFCVNVGYAGDLAFQRAAVLASKLDYWGPDEAVIRLQWMFPTRMRINVLRKAEDLSERADPSSLEQAIQLLRCAQGLETN